jgi:hypothetical protein
MSRAAISLFAFGAYLLILGLVLMFVPNALLTLFGLAPTDEVWIRVVAMLVLILGCYDVLAARAELTPFFRWSVVLRASVIVFFAAFVALGMVPPMLLVFGVVDLAAAVWTAVALRVDASRGPAAAGF